MTAAAVTVALLAAAPARAAAQPESGVELGVRLGYAFPAGNVGTPPNDVDRSLGDYVSGQVPIWFDAGYRFNPLLYLGAYFTYGLGIVNDDRQDLCRNANVDCSASDVRLGLMGRFHLPPLAMLSPWVGVGAGYEWGTFSFQQSAIGATNTDFGWSGWEFANFQAGADFRVAPKVVIAPFLSVSIDRFGSRSTTTTTANSKITMDDDLVETSLHAWILLGLRAAFAP